MPAIPDRLCRMAGFVFYLPAEIPGKNHFKVIIFRILITLK